MDKTSFGTVTNCMTRFPSRRDVMRGLAGTGLGLGIVRLPGIGEAKNKRKRKKRKSAKPNAYGCLEVNDPCKSADQCCSGICAGKKCRAHDTGICQQDKVGACTAPTSEVPGLTCGNGCYCLRTTAGSNFCAVPPAAVGSPKCSTCRKDGDCLAQGFPQGSACVPVGLGHCNGRCASGMACLVPCGIEFPAPTG